MSTAELVGLLSPFVVALTTRINTVADIKSFLHESKLRSRVDIAQLVLTAVKTIEFRRLLDGGIGVARILSEVHFFRQKVDDFFFARRPQKTV